MAVKSRASRNPNTTSRRPQKGKKKSTTIRTKGKKKSTTTRTKGKKKSTTTESTTTQRIPARVGARTTTRRGDKVEVVQETTEIIRDRSRGKKYNLRTKAEIQAEKDKKVRQSRLYKLEQEKNKELERKILSLTQQSRSIRPVAVRGENVAFTSQTPAQSSSVAQAELKALTEQLKQSNERLKSLEERKEEEPKEPKEPKEQPKSRFVQELETTQNEIQRQRIQRGITRRDEEQRRLANQRRIEEFEKKVERERLREERSKEARRKQRTASQQRTIFAQTQDTREQEEKILRKEKQKQEEAKSTIDRILKEANEKVKEKQRKQERINQQQQRTQERLRRVDAGLADKATKIQAAFRARQVRKTTKPTPTPEPEPSQTRFVVGGEGGIEVPFSSQEELLQAYRNRPNQPRPLPPRQLQEESDRNLEKKRREKEKQQKQKDAKEEEVRPAEGFIRPQLSPQQVLSEFEERDRPKQLERQKGLRRLQQLERQEKENERKLQEQDEFFGKLVRITERDRPRRRDNVRVRRQSHQQAQQEQIARDRQEIQQFIEEADRPSTLPFTLQQEETPQPRQDIPQPTPQPQEVADAEEIILPPSPPELPPRDIPSPPELPPRDIQSTPPPSPPPRDISEFDPDEEEIVLRPSAPLLPPRENPPPLPPRDKPPLVQETIRQFVDEAPEIPKDRPITQLELDTQDVIRRQSHQQAQQEQTTTNRQGDVRRKLDEERRKLRKSLDEKEREEKEKEKRERERKEVEETRDEIFKARQDKTATKIQSAVRGRQARKRTDIKDVMGGIISGAYDRDDREQAISDIVSGGANIARALNVRQQREQQRRGENLIQRLQERTPEQEIEIQQKELEDNIARRDNLLQEYNRVVIEEARSPPPLSGSGGSGGSGGRSGRGGRSGVPSQQAIGTIIGDIPEKPETILPPEPFRPQQRGKNKGQIKIPSPSEITQIINNYENNPQFRRSIEILKELRDIIKTIKSTRVKKSRKK